MPRAMVWSRKFDDARLVQTLGRPEGSYALAVAIFCAGWLVFAWPWLSGRVIVPWDGAAHFLPQVQFLAASIHAGEWPFWTPNVFGGHPQIADPQSQIFAPPMLLLALLVPEPGPWSIAVAMMLVLLAAGLGVIWLFFERGWHPGGALIAAFGFALGAAMAWRLQHFGQVMSMAYLPFALIFLYRALDRQSPAWGLTAGVVAGLILAGRDQVALLATYTLVIFVLVHWLSSDGWLQSLRRSVAPLSSAALAAILVAGMPILLTALLATQSNRPAIDLATAGAGSLHPALFVTALAPHLFGAAGEMYDYWGPPSFAWNDTGLFIAQNMGQLYIGAMAFILLAMGTVRGILWAPDIRFFTLSFILAAIYALGWYTPAFQAMFLALPGIDYFRRPADAVFLIGGFGAIMAGYAAHRLLTGTMPAVMPIHRLIEVAVIAAVFASMLAMAVSFERLGRAAEPLAWAALTFALAAVFLAMATSITIIRPALALLIVGGFTAADIAMNNGPNGASGLPPSLTAMLDPARPNPTLALLKAKIAETAAPDRRDRVELAGLGFHWPNASMPAGLDNTLGYNPVRLGYYTTATGAEDTVGLPDQRKFSALFPSYKSTLANLLGLRFIAAGAQIETIDKSLKPGDFRLVTRTPTAWVYENDKALPRVMFAAAAVTADFDTILKTGRWPPVDLTNTVVLQEPHVETTAIDPAVRGTVSLLSYKNTVVDIAVDSPAGGYVVLNDVWHPWWYAEIDGMAAPVLRANAIFRAVQVPPGRHRVRFVFRPVAGAISQLWSMTRSKPPG